MLSGLSHGGRRRVFHGVSGGQKAAKEIVVVNGSSADAFGAAADMDRAASEDVKETVVFDELKTSLKLVVLFYFMPLQFQESCK